MDKQRIRIEVWGGFGLCLRLLSFNFRLSARIKVINTLTKIARKQVYNIKTSGIEATRKPIWF
jgi:hypothetical protein